MLLYFLQGSLPWQGFTGSDQKPKEEMILEKKETMTIDELCQDLPREFAAYFEYIGSLDFNEKPDYSYLRRAFRDLFVREGFEYDHVYDWTVIKYLMATQ